MSDPTGVFLHERWRFFVDVVPTQEFCRILRPNALNHVSLVFFGHPHHAEVRRAYPYH